MNLFLIRGLPGSGKSTFAKSLDVSVVAEADEFFMEGNEYKFDPKLLPQAHEQCQRVTEHYLANGHSVAVANTFTMNWEIEPYRILGKKYGARVFEVTIETGFSDDELAARNLHSVPSGAIRRMRERWEFMGEF